MLRVRSQNHICEQEAKFVQERISAVEKHFAELCSVFAAFTRKSARLRDKTDEVAKVVQTYAESENINQSLSNGLSNFSTTLSVIGDYRDAEVQRLDAKVISNLSQYSVICKHAREDVRNTFTARDKELNRRRNLDKLRERNPRNRQMISQAESELMKATVEVSRVVKGLEEQIDSFERRKLHDIRSVLLDFVSVELGFHTKAVELFTKAYQDLAEIDVSKDLEDFQIIRGDMNGEFREVMRVPDSVSRLETVRRTSFRQAYSLTNLASRFTSSPIISKPGSSKPTESTGSLKTGFSNSNDSVRVEDYARSSEEEEDEESDSESIPEMPRETRRPPAPGRLELRAVPAAPNYQKSLTSSLIRSITYKQGFKDL